MTVWTKAIAGAGMVGAALALAACHPAKIGEGRNGGDRAVTVADRLDCPEEQGSLKRTIQAPNGKSCTSPGDDGEAVTLAYLALDGKTPEAALAPTEASFHALVPDPTPDAEASKNRTRSVTTSMSNGMNFTTSVTKTDDGADGDGDGDSGDATTGANGETGSRGKNDHVEINLPGLHIDAGDDGAKINAFGQNIVADDKGATVNGAMNGVKTSIAANDGGAEIRSGFVGKQAVDLTYVLASDTAGPNGAHAAAYVARGPVGGPLVVASGTLKEGDRHVDKDRFDDLRELVDRNVKRSPR